MYIFVQTSILLKNCVYLTYDLCIPQFLQMCLADINIGLIIDWMP